MPQYTKELMQNIFNKAIELLKPFANNATAFEYLPSIMDENNINFWLYETTDIDIKEFITGTYTSWELSQIFIYNNGDERLVVLAKRVIKAFETI